jgi:hypothetical protein
MTTMNKTTTTKSYELTNGETITLNAEGFWQESWSGDEYDTLDDLLEDLSDQDRHQFAKEITAQDAKR